MKLNKEKIVFIVVLLLVGWLAWDTLLSGDSQQFHNRRGGGMGMAFEELDFSTLPAAFLADQESGWTSTGRNIYRAPSEHSALPPLNLPTPPRPPLPTAPPQPVPGIDPFNRVALVAAIDPVSGVELPPRAESSDGELTSLDDPDDSDEPDEDDPTDPAATPTNDVDDKKILGLRERLRQDAIERVKKQREKLERERELAEQRRILDKIKWEAETWYGEVLNDAVLREGQKGFDKYQIKLKIDDVRSNGSLAQVDREKILKDREFEIEFRRFRSGKWDRRQKVSAVNVVAIEFGEGAVNAFELGKRATPATDLAAHLEFVSQLMAVAEYDRAKTHALWILANGHRTRELYIALAEAANQALDYDVEMRAVSEGLAKFPDDADLLAYQGELYSRLGIVNLATATFEQAFRAAARSPRVNAQYAHHLLRHGDIVRGTSQRALDMLERVASGRFGSPAEKRSFTVDLGTARLATGQLAEARRLFDEIARANPMDLDAVLGGASAAYLLGANAEARAMFNSVLEADPHNGRAYFGLALCEMAVGEWRGARDHLFDAFEADPFLTAPARVALGHLHEKIDLPGDAQTYYAAAYEADPSAAETILAHGRGFLLIGDWEQARTVLLEALGLMPDQFDVLAGLSEASYHLGRYEDSLRYLDAALALKADSTTLLVRKAQTLARLRRFSEAKTFLDEAKQVSDSDEVELSLAYYYYAQGNHDEALKRFRQVDRNLDPKDGRPLAVYTRQWAFEIAENLAKEVWTDHFNRVSSGRDLLREWKTHAPGSNISINLQNNRVSLSGTQRQSEVPTCIFQQRAGKVLVSYEATLVASKRGEFTAGIGLFTFRKNTGNQNPYIDSFSDGIAHDAIIVGKTPQGRLAYRVISRYEMGRWTEIPDESWPADQGDEPTPIQLGIALKDAKDGTWDILVNGNAVATVESRALGQSSRELQLWAFTQAEIEKRVDLKVDDVRIVTRKDVR